MHMKTKWFFVYVGVGIAFAAVSLWVFLSGGKSARAIRSKYKLGGILLMAWAMLSAANCNGPGPMVTCYEPAVTCYDVGSMEDILSIMKKDNTGSILHEGDILLIRIDHPSSAAYICRLTPKTDQAQVLQEATFNVTDKDSVQTEWEWKVKVSGYKGEVTVQVFIAGKDQDGNKTESLIGSQDFILQ